MAWLPLLILATGRAWGGVAPLKVALYVDKGCRGNGVARWAELLHDSPDVDLRLVDGADIRAGMLDDCKLLVMPGGTGGLQYRAMEDEGAEKLKSFVADGGRYFGTCCGMSMTLNEEPGFAKRLKMLPFQRITAPSRGRMMATVRFNARGAEWLGIRAGDRSIRYHLGPVLKPADPVPLCTNVEVLATMNCELAERGNVTGPMYGTPAVVRANYGKGEILAFTCHPEMYLKSQDLVVAGIRALTGRTIRIVRRPLKARGAERIGFFTGTIGDKSLLGWYLALRDDPNVDVEPVTLTELDEMVSPRFDRVLGLKAEKEASR